MLLKSGYDVRVLDSLQDRVHPFGRPSWLNAEAEVVIGDTTSRVTVEKALEGTDYVLHLAAYQDYQPEFPKYIRTNSESTALLFDLMVGDPVRFPVRKVILASSQAVNGEGPYACSNCAGVDIPDLTRQLEEAGNREPRELLRMVYPAARSLAQLERKQWEHPCSACGHPLRPLLMEASEAAPSTSYAISKYTAELLAQHLGQRYGIAVVCMRYTYVVGSRSSLYNPYSGIIRRFCLQADAGLPLTIYEDGQQLRDYVHVSNVADANILALESPAADGLILQVGGGEATSVHAVARLVLSRFDRPDDSIVVGKFRVGDTRNSVSDITPLYALGWRPTKTLTEMIEDYATWLSHQPGRKVALERLEKADQEMLRLGVVRG